MHQLEFFVLSYVENCVYWYKYETIGKWFGDTLGNILHMKFLGFSDWFISISISHLKENSISVDQGIYDTSVVDKYLDNSTVKKSIKFCKTTLPSEMIFTMDYISTSDDPIDRLYR